MSTLLFLVAAGCLLTQANCLQLQHEAALYEDMLEDGNCKYGYVVSLSGELWDKAPLHAPQNIGDFLTSQQVSFEGVPYYLRSHTDIRREYQSHSQTGDSAYVVKTDKSYIIGIWDQTDRAWDCARSVQQVAMQKMRR